MSSDTIDKTTVFCWCISKHAYVNCIDLPSLDKHVVKPNRVRFKSSTDADIILTSKTHELYSLQDPSLSHYLQAVYNTYTTIFKLLTVEKRTLIDHLTHFRKEFALPNKLRELIVRHPELFYLCSLLSLHGCYKYNKGAAGDGVDSTDAIAIDSERRFRCGIFQ
ncbi:unnamed protein product [Brassica napus]|uniref:(rape) hypothetical protein n=1 Tax=Brassica napus TaxID=3708 RepID=A0A816SPT7_BRANA|nr:unnamed protein product [Brassica napus]